MIDLAVCTLPGHVFPPLQTHYLLNLLYDQSEPISTKSLNLTISMDCTLRTGMIDDGHHQLDAGWPAEETAVKELLGALRYINITMEPNAQDSHVQCGKHR